MVSMNDDSRPQHVVFAAPFFMDATLAFIEGASQLPNTALTVISQVRALPDTGVSITASIRSRFSMPCVTSSVALARQSS